MSDEITRRTHRARLAQAVSELTRQTTPLAAASTSLLTAPTALSARVAHVFGRDGRNEPRVGETEPVRRRG